MRYTLTREMQIPKGARKVAHKATDAVVYLYENAAGLCALGFSGKRDKADFRYRYRSEAERERAVRQFFESASAIAARKADYRAEKASKRAKGHKLQVGHILKASWGYDQTNIDWYQIVELVGKCSVRTRKIGAMDASTGREPWMAGHCMPAIDSFTGEAELHRVSDGASVRIDDVRHAFLWEGRPANWTAYA